MQLTTHEPYILNSNSRLFTSGDKQVVLSKKEFSLAAYFLRNKNVIVPRRKLLADVWGIAAKINTRTVDVHVSRLRTRLLLSASNWEITCIYKKGYCFHETRSNGKCEHQ